VSGLGAATPPPPPPPPHPTPPTPRSCQGLVVTVVSRMRRQRSEFPTKTSLMNIFMPSVPSHPTVAALRPRWLLPLKRGVFRRRPQRQRVFLVAQRRRGVRFLCVFFFAFSTTRRHKGGRPSADITLEGGWVGGAVCRGQNVTLKSFGHESQRRVCTFLGETVNPIYGADARLARGQPLSAGAGAP